LYTELEIRSSFLCAGVFTNFSGDTRKLFHEDKEFCILLNVHGNSTLFHKMDAEIDHFLDLKFLKQKVNSCVKFYRLMFTLELAE